MDDSTLVLQESWARAWQTLGTSAPSGLMERLLARYAEPHRRYHSQQHLHECHHDGGVIGRSVEREGDAGAVEAMGRAYLPQRYPSR